MENLTIPPFLFGTTSWTNFGYFYAQSPPLDLRGVKARDSNDRWVAFAFVLEAAKSGDFQSLSTLHRWLSPPFYEGLSEACLDLLGDAGTPADLALIKQLLDNGPCEILPAAASAANFVGQLWLVPSMLSAWKRVAERDAHAIIGTAIARIVEPVGGRIAELAAIYNPDPEIRARIVARGDRYSQLASKPVEPSTEFEDAVVERFNELRSKFDDRVSLWRGEIFDVRVLMQQMFLRVRGSAAGTMQGLFIPMRHKLEATIGWNLSSCYQRGILNPIAATAVLEEIEEAVDLSKFAPGQRYFFGHPILH
jgi:hypothetical protein